MPGFKYGLLVGRFQPLHLGHELVIREMMALGLIPIIGVGSAQESGTERNPYALHERMAMLDLVLPEEAQLFYICDDPDWSEWMNGLRSVVARITGGEAPLHFVNRKPQDVIREEVMINGKRWQNFHWFDALGYPLHEQTYNRRLPPINATDIRKDIHSHRDLLHPAVYRLLREGMESPA